MFSYRNKRTYEDFKEEIPKSLQCKNFSFNLERDLVQIFTDSIESKLA